MAWHTEYGQALHLSTQLEALAGLDASLAAVRDVLLAGDPVRLLEAFPDGVRIDDERVGRIEGRATRTYGRGRSRPSLSVNCP